jgi:hypothetical protein
MESARGLAAVGAVLAALVAACDIPDRNYAGDSGAGIGGDAGDGGAGCACDVNATCYHFGTASGCSCNPGWVGNGTTCTRDPNVADCGPTSMPQPVKGTCVQDLGTLGGTLTDGGDLRFCSEYTGDHYSDPTVATRQCASNGGTGETTVYTAGATCDRTTAYGSCLILCGSAFEFVEILPVSGYPDVDAAQTECNGPLRGTWIPK